MGLKKGIIFDIQHFAVHDGPGIRTLVFLKGCNFRCPWCENPEGILPFEEIMYSPKRCIGDFICLDSCPEDALKPAKDERRIEVLWDRCTNCLECVDVCTPEAIKKVGKKLTAEEVLEEVKADMIFYGQSGGVTLSGGEPTLQREFAIELLHLCRKEGIDTAIETNGSASPEDFLEIILFVDHLLIDIKHMDSEQHKRYTGWDNKNVLENFKIAVKEGKDVIARVPVIPGFNMNKKSISEIAHFVKKNGGKKLHLLPYHTLGASKSENLGRPYPFNVKKSLRYDRVFPYKDLIESTFGLNVEIAG